MPNKITIGSGSKELNPRIEKMVEADIEIVMEIEKKSFDSHWKKKSSFIQYIERGDAFVVRTMENVIVGYVLIKRQEDTILLSKMAVDPEYRGKGFGKFIVIWAQKLATNQNARRLHLHVRPSNLGAINLYKNTGFEEIGMVPGHYTKTGEDAIEMQWVCS